MCIDCIVIKKKDTEKKGREKDPMPVPLAPLPPQKVAA